MTSTRPSIEIIDLGEDAGPITVVDRFSGDPDRWRSLAEGTNYAERGDFYPGRRMPVDPAYFEELGPRLGSILQTVYHRRRALRIHRGLYSIVSTPPQALSLAQRIPHIDDIADGRFAMVHYLSTKPFGGTAFFRHRATGYCRIAPARHGIYLAALEHDLARQGSPEAGYIAGDTPLFEQIGKVDFADDRAVIYPGNLLHCSIAAGGIDHPDDPASGRLTIASFFSAE